ncbi:MAG: phospho-sugar mutase [Candidatus Sumerlaeia bacterium]|nr:phospho-sugar mutase [Candidatus Sumerlaeia bacterium]
MADLKFDNPEVTARINEWTSEKYDDETRREISALIESGSREELEDRFYRALAFGTGGLRGKLGAGTNRMNSYIVARATQGLANYVAANATAPKPLRAAITHDSRHRSREFAQTAACVLAANGFYVHISPELRPTPYLSFAVRHLGCHTGIVVTASHNPKEYNGYKAYWDDGSQVVPPHDKGIIMEVEKIVGEDQVNRISWEDGIAQGVIKVMGAEMDEAYLEAVLKQRINADVIKSHQPRVVYTPLHGVGGRMVPQAMKMWGFNDVLTEPEQMKPNGDFPTAASPNPEEGAALERAIKLAEKEGGELVMATDPDADRVGIAVKDHNGRFELITGNQLCALLADYLLEQGKKAGRFKKRPGVVTTVVTSPLVQKVSEGHGAAVELTLTGFKWIAEQYRRWAADPDGPQFIYGTEESYGYLIGDHCLDKDGVVACCVTAEMAAHVRSQGKNIIDRLYEIYATHGVHYEWQKSVTLPGKAGAEKIAAILDRIRTKPPLEVAGKKVVRFTRLDTGEVYEDGRKTGKVDLPASDVFTFDLADGSRAIARPSGTEPKIKFYMFLNSGKPCASADEARKVYKQLADQAPAFQNAFLEAIGYTPEG